MKYPVQISKEEDRAIYRWKTCIHSGEYIKLVVTDKEKHEFVNRGYCAQKGEDLDIYPNCLYCDQRLTTAEDAKDKRAMSPTKRRRISRGRRRKISMKEQAKKFIPGKAINEYNKKISAEDSK